MEELKDKMIEEAICQCGEIYPVATKESFYECFTIIENWLVFWFNDCTGNTKAVMKGFICQK